MSAPVRPPAVAIAIAGLAVTAVAVAACGSDGGRNQATARPDLAGVEITIGSDATDQSVLLAEIYGAGLAARGATVAYARGLESPEDHLRRVERGEVTVVPELTHTLLTALVEPADPAVRTVSEQVDAIDAALPTGLTVLTPASAEDKPAVVCRDDVAEQYELGTLTDLGRVSNVIVLGGSDEPQSSSSLGLVELEAVLGSEFMSFATLPNAAAIVEALDSGAIDCGTLRSTTVSDTGSAFTTLDDDVLIVPNAAIVPLIAEDLATPEVQVVLDAVSSTLDTDGLTTLLTQIRQDDADPAAVATAWIKDNGLS